MARGDDKSRHFKKKLSGHGSLTKAGKVRDHTPDRGHEIVKHRVTTPRWSGKRRYHLVLLAKAEEEACRQFREYLNKRRDSIYVVIPTPMGPFIPSRKTVAGMIARNFSRDQMPT